MVVGLTRLMLGDLVPAIVGEIVQETDLVVAVPVLSFLLDQVLHVAIGIHLFGLGDCGANPILNPGVLDDTPGNLDRLAVRGLLVAWGAVLTLVLTSLNLLTLRMLFVMALVALKMVFVMALVTLKMLVVMALVTLKMLFMILLMMMLELLASLIVAPVVVSELPVSEVVVPIALVT